MIRKLSTKLIWVVKLLLGLSLLAFLFSRTDLAGVRDRLLSVQPGWLVLVFVMPHVAILASTVKWQALLRARGRRVPLWRLYVLYLMGTFFNNFLPSMVGGDVIRVYQLGREGDGTTVLAATFMERFVGLAALVSMLPLAALHPTISDAYPAVRWFVPAMILAYLFAVWLVFSNVVRGVSPERIRFAPLRRLVEKLGRTRKQVRAFRDARGTLLFSYVVSIVFYVLAALCVWLACRAVGEHVSFAYLVCAMPVVLAIGLIPISVNGLGLLETGYVVFLGLAGVPAEAALSAALLLRIRILITAVIGGIGFAFYRPNSENVSQATNETFSQETEDAGHSAAG